MKIGVGSSLHWPTSPFSPRSNSIMSSGRSSGPMGRTSLPRRYTSWTRARSRARCLWGLGCGPGWGRPGSRSPRTRGCGRRPRGGVASLRSPAGGRDCRSCRRRRRSRSGPWGASGGRGPLPRGSGASILVAASSSRSKLQSQGVTGIPPPRPKNSMPSIVVPSPCRTVAALQSDAGLAQGIDGLVVSGYEDGRRLDRGQRADRFAPAPRAPRRSRRRRSRRRPRPTSRPVAPPARGRDGGR